MVYLLHFIPPYKQARHYLGATNDLERRLKEHRGGILRHGSVLVRVALAAGCDFVVARTWESDNDFELERQLKRRKNAPKLCPLCRKENKNGQTDNSCPAAESQGEGRGTPGEHATTT